MFTFVTSSNLTCVSLGPLKEAVAMPAQNKKPLTALHTLRPELKSDKDTVSCSMPSGAKVPRHRQEQPDINLDCVFVKIPLLHNDP